MKAKIVGKVVRQLLKRLILSGSVVVFCILVMQVNMTLGVVLMMLYSSWMMVQSSRKEMPLGKFTAILPGLMSLGCFLFMMLAFFEVQNPLMPLVGLGLGLVPGWLMARGHLIYNKNGRLYAKRTYLYVLIWTVSLLFTQGSRLLGMREITDFGFLLNGFSTAVMVVLSIVLFTKINRGKNLEASRLVSIIFILITVGTIQPAQAVVFDGQNEERLTYDVGRFVFSSDLTSKLADVCRAAQADCKTVRDKKPSKGRYFFTYFLPNNSGFSQDIHFRLYDKQYAFNKNNSNVRNNWVSSKCGNKGQYRESVLFGGPIQMCNINIQENTWPPSAGVYDWWIRWEYGRWIVSMKYENFTLPDFLPDEAVKAYMFYALDSIAKKLTTVEILQGQATPQPDPKPIESDSSSQSNHDSSDSNDDFGSFVESVSSDEYLKSLSFDEWEKNNETKEDKPEPIEYWDEPAPVEYSDEPELQEQDAEIENVKPEPTTKPDLYPGSTSFELEFSDAEIASGAAVAILMLLASFGLNASTLVAQETASAVMLASQETGPTFRDKQGDAFDRNEKGEYLAPDDNGDWVWMGEDDARESSRALQAEVGRHQRESDRTWEDIKRDSNEWMDQKGREGLESQREMAEKLAAEEAAQLREKQKNEALLEKLSNAARAGHALSEVMIDQLKSEERWDELKQIYRDHLEYIVKHNEIVRDYESRHADILWVGEKASQLVLAGSKGAMLVVGGPAGAAYTGLGMGAISAAEEGAESQARGDDIGKVMAHTAAGFLVGVKDGTVSVYVNLPGTSKLTKILLPAGTDAAETYIRTGDAKQALQAGGYSVAADLVGIKTDKIKGSVTREMAELGTTALFAGTQNYQNGGSFIDGVGNGMLNHVGSKAGGTIGGKAIDSGLFSGVDPERGVNHALDEVSKASKKTIELENQSEIVKELNGTRRPATEAEGRHRTDADGELLKDKNGKFILVDKEYVDSSRTLDQLQDTQSSRTAKQAEDGIKNAIIDTRQDKIYEPANDATINALKNSTDPDTQKWLKDNFQAGDELKMDAFSTPGKAPSLGADRDARMAIYRTDPATGDTIKIEVPLKHWGDQAYKDFYEHSKKLHAEAGRDLDAEIKQGIENGEGIYASRNRGLEHLQQPEFSDKQLDAMRDNLRSRFEQKNESQGTGRTSAQIDAEVEKSIRRRQEQGLTAEQVKHRTFAEAHNQLFTDKHHMEASRANADQGFKIIEGQGMERTQVRSNVLDAKDGSAPLNDPEGFARMWAEKSHFYHDNPAEAMAQSKKGISEMMGLRDGQRAQGLDPAPLKPELAEAMEILVRAPTGIGATPEAIDRVNRDILAIRDSDGRQVYHSSFDAMKKVGRSVEFNKWTESAELNVKAVNRPGQLTGSEASRIARMDQERDWARELEEQGYE